jgi:hypothetical protein
MESSVEKGPWKNGNERTVGGGGSGSGKREKGMVNREGDHQVSGGVLVRNSGERMGISTSKQNAKDST